MKRLTTFALGVACAGWSALVLAAEPLKTNAPPATPPPAAVAAPATNGVKPALAAAPASAKLPASNAAPAAVKAAAPSTPPPPARNIRFQFEGIPYADVLERFAQMVGKPLVADTNLQGTLTFNDPQPYTYQEALDMLNLMLSMKGMMLMESGHYLQLVPFKQLPQMPLKIVRGTDQTGDVRPGEVVTVVMEVANLDAKEFAESVTTMLSNAGSVAALPKGRGLIVTDRLSNIQRIRYLLSQIDIQATADRQMKTYTLLHASGAILADLLNRTFGVATAPKRTQFNPQTKNLDVLPPDPNDYITAVYDDASRTLVLFGPRERLALADEMITKFEDKGGSGGDVRIYYPQALKADELALMIRQAVPGIAAAGEVAAAAATKARLITDTAQNRLIVAAPIPGQLDAIENFILQVDKGVQGAKGAGSGTPIRSTTIQLTKIFRPRAAEATNVAQILTQALTRRSPSGQILTSASVSYEANSQSIVVSGSPGDVQIATDIVTQLETGSATPRPLQTKFIDVGGMTEAKRLLPLVEQLYRNQVSDGLGGQVAHAKILADPDSGQLIVTASEEHLAKIEALVKSLRTERAKPLQRPLQIVIFKHVRVDSVIKGLTDLVTERMNEKRFQDIPKPTLVPDSANNRLLVTATVDQYQEIEQVIKLFDVEPQKARRDMSVIPVQSKPAAEIITLVTQLMPQVIDEPLNPQLAPKLFPDPTGKQIIVLATAPDVERIAGLIRQFDTATASATTRQFKGVDLFSRNTTEFTPLVTQLYQEQIKGQVEPAGGPATLIADTKNNRIMVSGSEKEIARVEALIRQLDPEGRKPAKEETRVVRLKSASAAELSGLVEKSLNANSQQVRVMVDQRSNSLVVTGDPAAVEAASKIIQELDTRSSAGPREMRIIELKHGEASVLTPMLTTLFTEMVKDQRGADYQPQAKLVADAAANRIILTGPRDELTQISTLVDQLDAVPEQTEGARVFKLNTADATTLATTISSAMTRYDSLGRPIKRVSVAADEKSNSLVVSGTRQDLQDASVMIEQLDGQAVPGGRGRTLKILEVKAEDAESLATLAMKIFSEQNLGKSPASQISITPEPSGKRLIVMAPPALLEQVETVITSLDSQPDQVTRELQTLELKNAAATDLLPTVQKIYAEQNQGKLMKPATIYADASGSRLMVYGTKEQAAQLRQIVEIVESQKRVPRETKVFDVGRLAEATRLLPLVQQLYRDQLANNPLGGPADAQMVSDGRTGRLIVSARQDQLKLIEDIFTRLQAGALTNQGPRETRAFDVGTPAEVQRLVPLVQQLYQDQWKDRLETDPADAQVVGDPRAGRIIATGKPDHLKQIDAILRQLGVQPASSTNAPAAKSRTEARDTRIYDLTTASAIELATTVRTLYLDQAKSRLGTLTPDTLIVPDAGGNRLIVVGEPEELADVEDIIKKLDKVSAQSASARVFKLKAADPTKVAEILTTALVSYDAYGRPKKRATVSVDAKTRMLIVTGDPKELQSVSVIIDQLDTALGTQVERKMKVVSFPKGRVAEITAKLRQLYNDQLSAQPDLATSDILILEDTPSNQLLLAGSEPQLQLLEKIIGDLQAAQTSLGARETKMLEIGNVDEMQRLQPLVQQLYQERWRDHAANDPADAQIVTDARNARFIVTARTNHLAEIEAIIAQLRAGTTNVVGRDTQIVELSTANAAEFATTVRSLYLDQSKNRPGSQAQDTLIQPDVSANRLIVSGASNEVAMVEEIIKKLDKVSTQSGTVRLFKLKSADPAKVMEILANALTSYDSYGRARRRVGVTLDSKTRTIIVAGDPKELQSLQNAALIIEQLDTALGIQAERNIKVLSLKQAKVAEMLPKVRQLYNDQLSSRPELGTTDVLMLDDTASNQLILAGSDAQLKLIEKIVTDLQAAATQLGLRQTKMIEIGQVDELQRLQPLVQQLYQDRWKNQPASDPADAVILMDAKNGRFIVTARTNHLAEIEAIVAQLRGQQPPAVRDTRVLDLTTANAVELATTVKALYQDQIKSRPSPPAAEAAIVPDAVANRLVVSGPTNELELVEELVKKLDKVGAQSASVRVFKLKQADPEKVVEILQSAMVRYDAYGRSQKRVSVSVDPKSRTIILTGDPKELQGASVILEQLDSIGAQAERKMKVLAIQAGKVADQMTKVRAIYDDQVKAQPELGTSDLLMLEDSASNQLILAGTEKQLKLIEDTVHQLEAMAQVQEQRETRVYELTSTSAPEIATTVKSLYQEAVKSHPTSPARQALILPDVNANRLIVAATTNDLRLIDDIIQKIDKTEAQSGRTRVFHLKQAEAEQVATILSTALVQMTPYGRQVPRISVGTDKANNLLIVSGAPPDLQGAAMIIEQMDQVLAQEPRQLRVLALTNGLASDVATRLKSLYQDQLKGRPKTGGAEATILGDDVANRLIITASESHMKLIEEIASKLQETGQGLVRQTRVLPLQRNSATSVAAMITQLFAREIASKEPGERLAVSASSDDRMLVVDAGGKMLEKVEQLVQTLDTGGAAGALEVRTYQVPDGNVLELAQSLSRLFAERAGTAATVPPVRRLGPPAEQPSPLAPRFEADAEAKVLMVAATREQFVQIDKLIEDLKKTAAVSSELRTFVLKNAHPEQVSEVLENMLADGLDPQRRRALRANRALGAPWLPPVRDGQTVRVTPAPALNAVVVQGSPEKIALADKLIQTLDKTDPESQSVIQTVHLKKARALDLAEAVNKTIAAKAPAGRLQRVSVTGVDGPNSILVNGPNDAVQEVLKLIRDLDQESESDEIEVRIYKLENGNAKEVSAVIQQLLLNVTRAQTRPRATARATQATVSVDDRSNSLIISATPTHFKVVEKILPTLDKLPERSERDVQFVWLKNAKSMDVASKVESVFAGRPEADQPVVEYDSFANLVTVIAKRSDMTQIQEIIARLDEASKDRTVQVRLLPLDRVPAEQMAKMLQNIYPQMSTGRIRLVDKLAPPPPEPTAPKAAPTTNQPPSAAAAETPPEVVIALDKTANALILSGPGPELDQIDRIVTELTFTFISTDAEFRVFTLKEADPVIVARTLNELFKQEQVQVPPQRPGEPPRVVQPAPKITVVAEPRTRSVIVRAKPQDYAVFEPLIQQLDVSGVSEQLAFRVVPLTNAQPDKVVGLVQQMVTQMSLVRPGEPLTVSVDARARGILVVARDTVLVQVEKMIRSLDSPSAYAEGEVRVITLKKASAPQLALVLNSILKPAEQNVVTPEARELQEQVRRLKIQNDQGEPVTLDLTKPIKVLADPQLAGALGGNRLIITSTADNLKAVAAVVEMMDTVPVVEGVDVKIVRLQYADAATVSQTLNTIFLQAQRLALGPTPGRAQPEGDTGKALVSPLNVAIDARSNTLIVSGKPESIELAMKVVKDLDQEIDRFVTEVKLFRLKHASAIRLLPMLQAVFTEGPRVPGTEGLSTMVTRLRTQADGAKSRTTEAPKARAALVMQADDLSNTLIVAARSDALPLIEDVINQLDIPAASGLETVRIYPLNHADAVAVAKVITDLHSGPRATQMRNEDKPQVVVDDRINALIITGNTKAFAVIDGLLQQLDQKLPFDLRDIHIIPLENAEATIVAATIQRLMDARITQKATLNRQQADALKVIVIADTRSNSLLVGGSKDSFELVDSLAKELDGAPPALSGRIRLVPLQYADARVLATTLSSMFTQRYAAARTPDVQRRRPIILADPRSNSLLVAADTEDNKALDDLLQKLDRKMENPALTLTIIPLKHNDCARLATLLEATFTARLRAMTLPGTQPLPADTINIEPEPLNNALIVSASKENLEMIQGLLQKLDAEPEIAGGVLEAFVLQHADAQRVSTMLRSLVQQGLYRPGAPAGGVKVATAREALAISVDPRSNTLFISASPENLVMVKEVIKRVDTKDFAESGNVRFYEVKKARASSLATVLTQFFTAKRTAEAVAINATERSVPVSIIPDDRVNTLLIVGSKESFDIIDRILPQLDGEDAFTRINFRVFPLQKATASKLQSTLQQIVANRPPRVRGEPVEPINIVADQWVNALLIGASAEDMPVVASLIEKLDSEATDLGISVQVFPLAKADARRVAATIQALFREGTPGTTLPVSVNADERLNAIVVSAGELDAKRIGELVKKLDSEQTARVSEIKVFALKYARAESLSTILNQALNAKPTPLTEVSPNTQSVLQFITRSKDGQELVTAALKEGVLITADARMNSLIVSGPVDYMGLIEQIINHLDLSSPQQAKIKVFTLVNADARQMSELLMAMFRMQTTGGGSPNQRSVQYTLVREKVDEEAQPGEEEEVASATLGTAEQNALTVTVDPRTNSLLVGGTEHYVDLVSQVINTLDSSTANERTTEVVRLRNVQAQDVALAIRTFLDQEKQRITSVLGAEAVGTSQRVLEREVAIVAESTSNNLMVSANPRYFNEIKQMIEKLDEPQPQVLIQVLLAEVTLTGSLALGVEGKYKGTKGDVDISSGTDFGQAADVLQSGGFSTLITGSDFNVLLRALQTDGRLEVLSRPQIVTADNKPASINVGQRVPIITDSRVDVNNNLTSSFRYEDLGVTLYVTPRITSDGFVKMDIGTTNSVLSTSTVTVGSGKSTSDLPIINQRRATTTVSVQSGQTIIIGGLIATVDDTLTKKVPLLGDLPVLGFLFRSTSKQTDRKELLILLTPQILANTKGSGKIIEPGVMTQEQLDRSNIKFEIKRDPMQKQLLDPLFPEETQPGTGQNPEPKPPRQPDTKTKGQRTEQEPPPAVLPAVARR